MLATAGVLPQGPGWAYEFKWDGVRALVDIAKGSARIMSRNGNDVTAAYPELLGIAAAVPDALLDGEIVVLVDGRPSFEALQTRMHVRQPAAAAALAEACPVTFLVFDLLRLYGVPLLDRPYAERRATLDRLALDGPHWAGSPSFDDGPATERASRDHGLEGIVAKRLDSRYHPGTRSREWVKVKHAHTQAMVVGGWRPGEGGRAGQIGSLLLGVYDAGGLAYTGHVGSGFTGRTLAELGRQLAPLRRPTSPFATPLPREHARDAQWCEPRLVVQVRFSGWTRDGRLWQPVYRGLRPDKEPTEVTREP